MNAVDEQWDGVWEGLFSLAFAHTTRIPFSLFFLSSLPARCFRCSGSNGDEWALSCSFYMLGPIAFALQIQVYGSFHVPELSFLRILLFTSFNIKNRAG